MESCKKSKTELGFPPCTEPGEYDLHPFTYKEVCSVFLHGFIWETITCMYARYASNPLQCSLPHEQFSNRNFVSMALLILIGFNEYALLKSIPQYIQVKFFSYRERGSPSLTMMPMLLGCRIFHQNMQGC